MFWEGADNLVARKTPDSIASRILLPYSWVQYEPSENPIADWSILYIVLKMFCTAFFKVLALSPHPH